MIYIDLLWAFLRIGIFSFGGAHGSIPLIRDVVLSYGWISDEMFIYFVAVSESTPGPIMINLATYIGSVMGGFWGAVLATAGVVLPSFFIILFIAAVMKNFIENKYVQSALKGIRPCFIGIILATGSFMIVRSVLWIGGENFDWRTLLLSFILLALSFGYPRINKKAFSSILLILISAGLGIILYAI
jgi:chromate transporter